MVKTSKKDNRKEKSGSSGSESEEEDYVVEKILNRRVKNGRVSDITTLFECLSGCTPTIVAFSTDIKWNCVSAFRLGGIFSEMEGFLTQ